MLEFRTNFTSEYLGGGLEGIITVYTVSVLIDTRSDLGVDYPTSHLVIVYLV